MRHRAYYVDDTTSIHSMLGCKEMRICQELSRNSLMVVTPIDWGLDNGGTCDGLDHSARMHGRAAAVYHSVESVVCISGVGDSADSTVWLHQAVLALYYVTIPFLPLALDVSSMNVIYTVVEAVFGIRLEVKTRVILLQKYVPGGKPVSIAGLYPQSPSHFA